MGQLAFLKMFILVSIPTDANDNRRHVHVFKYKGRDKSRSLAKIWIERRGEKCIEIAESSLSTKENKMLIQAISEHWEEINSQIDLVFDGKKTIAINLEK